MPKAKFSYVGDAALKRLAARASGSFVDRLRERRHRPRRAQDS
jgi:hypothetical protein